MILTQLFSQRSNHILHSLHQASSIKNRLRCISAPRSWSHKKNTVVLTFRQIQGLYLMYGEVAWVLACSGTHVQSQIILDPDYLSDYPSVSYDYVSMHEKWSFLLRISSVNVTKSALSCGFDHLLRKSLIENFIFYAVFSITKTFVIIMFSSSSLDMLLSLGLKIMSNIFMSNIGLYKSYQVQIRIIL